MVDLNQLFVEMEETFEKAFKVVNELKEECDYMLKCENTKETLLEYKIEEIEILNEIELLKDKLDLNKQYQLVSKEKQERLKERNKILNYLRMFE